MRRGTDRERSQTARGTKQVHVPPPPEIRRATHRKPDNATPTVAIPGLVPDVRKRTVPDVGGIAHGRLHDRAPATSGALFQQLGRRMGDRDRRHALASQHQRRPGRRGGDGTEPEADLPRTPVTLALVAPQAGRDRVGPAVVPATRTGKDVINRGGDRTAVTAPMVVPGQHPRPRPRRTSAVPPPGVDVTLQSQHSRSRIGAMKKSSGLCLMDDCDLTEEHAYRMPQAHPVQRTEVRVEYQH